jgi:hypothetical protein
VLAGKNLDNYSNMAIMPWTYNECGVCGRKMFVVPPEDWGHFTPEQLAEAKDRLKKLGLVGGRKPYAEPADVVRFIDVVEGVLGNRQSYMTKICIRDIKKNLEKGKPVAMYDIKQLVYWYAKDCGFVPLLEEKDEQCLRHDKQEGSVSPVRSESGDDRGQYRKIYK